MAINFPNSPSNGDQHTASGITWTYDGTTWKADGVTASYSLPTASSTVLGGIKVGTNLSINGAGELNAFSDTTYDLSVQQTGGTNANPILRLNPSSGTDDDITITGGSNVSVNRTSATEINISATGPLSTEEVQDIVGAMFSSNTETNITATYQDGDGTIDLVATAPTGLDTRSTFTATTASLANNVAGNIEVTAHKSYSLLKIKPSIAAWVTLYVDAASRTADANRVQGADPAPDAGVIAEVITTAANQEIKMSPAVLGWHQDAGNDAVNTVFCKVVNKSGSTGTCTVSLTVVQLEA